MKAYVLLLINKSILEKMNRASLRIEDLKYIEMYQEYERLCKEYKATYVVCSLADKYNVSERTVYRLVDRFSKEIKL